MHRKPVHLVLSVVAILGILFYTPGFHTQASSPDPESIDRSENRTVYPEAVGQLGGYTYSVARQDGYAYIAVGPRLLILDVSNPAAPVLLGESSVQPEFIRYLAVQGDYAYLSEYSVGLQIMDISNPTRLVELGQISMGAMEVDVQGNCAFVVDWDGLKIIDVSDPNNPYLVGSYEYPIVSVEVVGNYVYAGYAFTSLEYGMVIIDATNPASPIEVGHIITNNYPWDVFVSGSTAYIADGGLTIVDVSDPTQPKQLSSSTIQGDSLNIYIEGTYAYIADGMYGLTIFDISDPNLPKFIGNMVLQGDAIDIEVADNLAFIASGRGGMRIIDVSVAANPKEVGFFMNSDILTAKALEVRGKYVYVADMGGTFHSVEVAGLRVVDISDPAAPTQVGKLATDHSIFDVEVAGNYAYLAADDGGLLIVDISDPERPTIVGNYTCGGGCVPGWAVGVKVIGNLAYIVSESDGVLNIIDVTDPTSPQLVNYYETHGQGSAISVRGNLVYFADLINGLRVIDVTDPLSIKEIGFYKTPSSPFGVTLSGNYAYVADWFYGLRIIDISNPELPAEVGFFNPHIEGCISVSVVDDYVYLGCRSSFIFLDVSNPTSPVEVGSYSRYAAPYDSVVRGNEVFIAYDYIGLLNLRLFTDHLSSSIPENGSSLTSTDGMTSIIFPSGAFTQTVNLTYQQLFTDEHVGYLAGVDHTFEISGVYSDTGEPASIAPGKTYTITVTYSDSQVSPVFEKSLALYNWNGVTWVREPTSVLDPGNNTITATPGHLSLWAVLGDTHRVLLPILGK